MIKKKIACKFVSRYDDYFNTLIGTLKVLLPRLLNLNGHINLLVLFPLGPNSRVSTLLGSGVFPYSLWNSARGHLLLYV